MKSPDNIPQRDILSEIRQIALDENRRFHEQIAREGEEAPTELAEAIWYNLGVIDRIDSETTNI